MKKKSEIMFDKYTSNYDKSIIEIRLKYYHSYRVEKLMKELAIKLNLSKEEIRIAELIGLLHDIGRFEQVKKYGTCSDVKSGVDHGDQSCIYLFDEGHIRDYIDDDKYDSIIKDAIKYHNKLKIDDSVKDKNLLFAKMIKDMDKVDIYRVLKEEYTGSFNVKERNEKVYKDFMSHKLIDNHDKKSRTDSVYAHFAFLYDVFFKESYEILDDTNNLNDYLTTVTVVNDDDNNKAWLELLNEVYKYMNDFRKKD